MLVGGTIFPIIAGAYYYFPLIWGKQLSDRLGRIAFWLLLIGFNVTFLPMHWTGLRGMPRRVFTYPADMGFDALNLVSTLGAFLLAAGFLVVVWDIVRPKSGQPVSERNPWNAGTLEWLAEMPDRVWGIRSIPIITSRYPLWDQPDFVRDVDEGRFYLPDAQEGLRETLVTSVIDATPQQCLRVPGPSWLPLLSALFTGGVFIFATYHSWVLAITSGLLAMATILIWLWTGTAWIPEKDEKQVGLDLSLPIYVSGPQAVGWWAMCITMLGDGTAFVSLVFSYFFYWTVHDEFPPSPYPGPEAFWPAVSLALIAVAWGLTQLARRLNRDDRGGAFYGVLSIAVAIAVGGGWALVQGPRTAGLDPTTHVYPAIVWVLVGWTTLHVFLGVVMQLYCLARRAAGRMTARCDADITNVSLYWHFLFLTALITVGVIAGFPLVA